MSVSGLGSTDVSKIYPDYNTNPVTAAKNEKAGDKKTEEAGAVFEKSTDNLSVNTSNPKKADRSALVAQLKNDLEQRKQELMDIVRKTITGQGKAYSEASGDDSIWKYLASGEFTVDELAKKKAQEDISEDGYWGVKQTSDRILDFAKALSGDDPTKAKELLDAFDKGYKEATKEWGKDLPDISKQTYDAVHKKFEDWANSVNNPTATEV